MQGFKGGPLKDGADWAKVGLKPNQKIMLIGTAGEIKAPPTSAELKEMEEEKPEAMLETPVGLTNLGNTCYMNSTLQCMRRIPELKNALIETASHPGANVDAQLASATGALFANMDRAQDAQQPFMFMAKMHSSYPQFAEKGQGGGLMQHDAEECWNALLMSFARTLPRGAGPQDGQPSQDNSLISDLFKGETQTRMKCQETEAEPEKIKKETFQRMVCNMDVKVSHLMAGMELALESEVEGHSEVLGRNAIWNNIGRVSKLPYYLNVTSVRFAWRQELNKGAGDRAKILRPVSFPMELDMYQLCTKELQASMEPARKAQDERREHAMGLAKTHASNKDDADALESEPMDTGPEEEPFTNQTGRYELFAVLSHQGRAADSGHYVAWSKYEPRNPSSKDRKDLWVKWDDDKPSFVLEEDIKRLSGSGGADHFIGYMFLYRTKKE